MKNISYLVIAAIILGAALTSCNDNDDNDDEVVFLLDETQNGTERTVYEYDKQNRIAKISKYNDGQLNWVESLSYNINGDLVEMKTENVQNPSINYKTTFYKNSNKITYDEVFSRHSEIELNIQGLPVKYTIVYDNGGGDGRTATIINTWQNGNILKSESDEDAREFGEEGRIVGLGTFTHDNMKSPFYHCKTPEWFLWMRFRYIYGKNNIKTETWEFIPPIFYVLVPTYEYDYNDDGLPVIKYSIYPDGYIHTETYTYKKKLNASSQY